MYCSKCGKQLEEDSVFCPKCGTKVEQENGEDKTVNLSNEDEESVAEDDIQEDTIIENDQEVVPTFEMKVCPKCGLTNEWDAKFCGGCGYTFVKDDNHKGADNDKRIEKIKKLVIILVAAIVVIASFVGAIIMVPKIGGTSKTKSNILFYIKDNEIYAVTKKGTQEVSDKYFENSDNAYFWGYNEGTGPQLSKSGKYIFYIRRINENGKGDLYYQKKGDPDTEQKLASSIDKYYVLNNDKVVYETDDSKLYISDIKGDKNKICEDVINFIISEDEKSLVYTEEDGDNKKLYYYDLLKNSKEKMASISYLCGVSEDNKTIVYMKDDELHVIRDFKDEDKIASNVTQCYSDVDGNKVQLYYAVQKDENSVTCYDLVDDDLFDEDRSIRQPVEEDYRRIVVTNSYWGPRQTYEIDDSYYDALQEFYDKEDRDDLREYLKQEKSTYYEVELFRYAIGDKEPESLGKYDALDPYAAFGWNGAGNITVSRINLDDMELVKFSDIYDDGINFNSILSNAFDSSDKYLLHENFAYLVDRSYKYPFFDVNGKDGRVYMKSLENDTYEIYEVVFSNEEMSYNLILEDADYYFTFDNEGINVAFCDVNAKYTSADLYIDGVRVDSDVYPGWVDNYPYEEDLLFYMKDFNNGEGDLYLYNIKTKKVQRIDDDVRMSKGVAVANNKYYYFVDYSEKSNEGDLMVFDGKKATRVDSDVSAFYFDMLEYDYGKEYIKVVEGMFNNDPD